MKFNQISGVTAIAFLSMVGSAYADSITAITVGATPPPDFALMNLGTNATAGYVGDANSTITNPELDLRSYFINYFQWRFRKRLRHIFRLHV